MYQRERNFKTQEKCYLTDTALRYSVLEYDSDTVAGMLENVVYLELRVRGYDIYVGKLDITEVDFVAIKQDEKIYI
jgi:predicted AAA+ superfamily ATPase